MAVSPVAKSSPGNSFSIARGIWQEVLAHSVPDPVANIRHAELGGEAAWRLHVAEIADKVACHVHLSGFEVYEIVAGTGNLFSGPVEKGENQYRSIRNDVLPVRSGDVFTVPEGFAHQLVRTSPEALIIIFACPDSHLAGDRIILPDLF